MSSDLTPTTTIRCISEQSLEILYEMQEAGLICDAVLKTTTGGYFPVHRAIMSVCSPYFRALFTTQLNQERTEFTIPGITADILKLVIEYAYLRYVPVTIENVVDVLVAADQFNIMGLVRNCEQLILSNMEPENCIGIRTFSRIYFRQELERKAQTYLLQHFLSVADKSEEFLELSAQELVEILQDDELNVSAEEKVWEVVVRWVDVNPDLRRRHVYDLLRKVRFVFVETNSIVDKICNHPYICTDEDCKLLVQTALSFVYELATDPQSKAPLEQPDIARPRVPHQVLFAVGGWSGGTPTNVIETYDSRADRWLQMSHVDPAGARSYHGCVVVGFDVYVIGGFNGEQYFNSCRCFNVVSKTWREISPMYVRRCYVSATALKNTVYALGGYDGQQRQRTAEKYQQDTNQWTMISPMTARRSDASATVFNNRIYIVGGFNGQECLNSAEVYDPESDQWTLITPMTSRRSGVSCVAHNGCVFAVGGFNGVSRLRSVEKFNPLTQSWTPIADMFHFKSNFAAEVVDDTIYTIGGFNGVTTIADVECFDERSNEWVQATDLNLFRSALSACVVTFVPNVYDYVLKDRDHLIEDRRQRVRFLQS